MPDVSTVADALSVADALRVADALSVADALRVADAPALADALARLLADPPAAWPPEILVAGGVALAAGLAVGAMLGGGLAAAIAARRVRRREGQLSDRFESLAGEALDRSNERFLALAGERLGALERSNVAALAQREAAVDALVRPLRESLARVDEKLQRVETEREGHYRSLTRHLELVATGHRQLVQETRGLRQALGAPNARGRWGELQLRRVVELAGMLAHCDFVEQPTLDGTAARDGAAPRNGASATGGGAAPAGASGGGARRSRPDLVVHLPGDRQIVVDAKAPLEAYVTAAEAEDEATRRAALADHARHVRRHVDDLGARAYWSQLEGSPEFVVLFLPGEPFFSAAVEADPELIERGVDKKVLLAGPTTLIALLRAVAYGWQQEAMARNAIEVSRLGRELYERIVSLDARFATLGKKLDGAVEAYNAAIGTLESRVHVSARRMAELGVASGENLDRLPRIERPTRRPRETSDDPAEPGAEAPPAPNRTEAGSVTARAEDASTGTDRPGIDGDAPRSPTPGAALG